MKWKWLASVHIQWRTAVADDVCQSTHIAVVSTPETRARASSIIVIARRTIIITNTELEPCPGNNGSNHRNDCAQSHTRLDFTPHDTPLVLLGAEVVAWWVRPWRGVQRGPTCFRTRPASSARQVTTEHCRPTLPAIALVRGRKPVFTHKWLSKKVKFINKSLVYWGRGKTMHLQRGRKRRNRSPP